MSWLAALRGKRAAVDERRWVMLDVETSGLDARRDQLLAIAAIGLQVDWPAKRLSIAPASTGELAKPFGMALPSFLQHLRVLALDARTGLPREERLREEPHDVVALDEVSCLVNEEAAIVVAIPSDAKVVSAARQLVFHTLS